MSRALEIACGITVAIVGVVLWIALPEVRTILALLLSATLIYRVFVATVHLTAKRIIGDQLIELRTEVSAIAERLEHIDRTNALFLDLLRQRQEPSPKKVIGSSVSKRLHAMH
jgi:hypothetical protein